MIVSNLAKKMDSLLHIGQRDVRKDEDWKYLRWDFQACEDGEDETDCENFPIWFTHVEQERESLFFVGYR